LEQGDLEIQKMQKELIVYLNLNCKDNSIIFRISVVESFLSKAKAKAKPKPENDMVF